MRSSIAFIALIATVMHFTLGCCLHPAHVGGEKTCCGGTQDSQHGDACCEGHDHGLPRTAASRTELAAGAAHTPLVAAAAAHDCGGCRCAATKPEAGRFSHASPAVAWRCLPVGTTQAASAPAAGVDPLTGKGPIPSALWPPLHERYLV